MSYAQMIVCMIIGALFAAHPKVAPVLGPVTTGFLDLLSFLISRGWAWLLSRFQPKPKQETAPTVLAAHESQVVAEMPAATESPAAVPTATESAAPS